jgi:hypothetical protein
MENCLEAYIAAQSNLSEEEIVFGLCGVINLLPLLGYSLDDLVSAWKEACAPEDLVDFDVDSFNPEDPWGFARAVVDSGHVSQIRVPLGEAVFRQVKEADEAILYMLFHDFSVGTTQVSTF